MNNHLNKIKEFNRDLRTIIRDYIPTKFDIENSSPLAMELSIGFLEGMLEELQDKMINYLTEHSE